MDQIQAELAASRYVEAPHLVIVVDGHLLDEWLTATRSIPADRLVALQRADPEPGTSVVAPLLVCPGDLDFLCTTVVAEVARSAGRWRGRRFGVIEATEKVSIRGLIDAVSPRDLIEAPEVASSFGKRA